MKTFRLMMLTTGSALALAACDGGSGGYTPNPPSGPTALEDNFGAAFGVLFRANANTDSADPGPNSVIPVSVATDPVPVP